MSALVPVVPAAVAGLEPFVAAGRFGAGEVQLAATVARLVPGVDPAVLLALAVAARAPSLGHVGIELAAVDARLHDDRTPAGSVPLPWPDLATWTAALEASPAVATPADHLEEPLAPLVWDGRRIYLHRYWCYELLVADDVRARAAAGGVADAGDVGSGALATALTGLFPEADRQHEAARVALTNRLSVVAGGPGTGKTHTIARILAAAHQVAAAEGRRLEVALAAPTGKAAARMTAAVRRSVADAGASGAIDAVLAEVLGATEATTVHTLLGWAPGVRFRHDRGNPLPHDLVIVDETSMVSLPLMARLLQAVRPEARLVLVGDPDQLASVDAGTVLADLVGPRPGSSTAGPADLPAPTSTSTAPAPGAARRRARAVPADDVPRLFDVDALTVEPHDGPDGPTVAVRGSGGPDHPLAGRVTVLDRVHRFGAGSGIAELADAVRRGDAGAAWALLDGSRPDLALVDPADRPRLLAIEAAVVAAGAESARAALGGDAAEALAAAHRVKVLAAVRHGEGGLYDWSERIEAGVAGAVPALEPARRWYVGRPVLVTANDRANRVANGDVGVVVEQGSGTVVALVDDGASDGVRRLPASRLHEVETWWAMTIHKSQGSEFPHVVVALPEVGSPILTRELLYTAVTRAREQVTIVASAASLRAAIERPVARASGLGPRLWP